MHVKIRTPLHVYYIFVLYSNYAYKWHVIMYMYGCKFTFIIVLWSFIAYCQFSRFDRFERWRVCTRWWVNGNSVRERFTKYLDIRLITLFFLSLGPFNLTLCITKLRHCRGCYSGFAEANVNYDWASEKFIWYFYEKAKKNETENGLYKKNNLTSKHVIAQIKQIPTKREWENYLEWIMIKFIEDIIDYWTPMINK